MQHMPRARPTTAWTSTRRIKAHRVRPPRVDRVATLAASLVGVSPSARRHEASHGGSGLAVAHATIARPRFHSPQYPRLRPQDRLAGPAATMWSRETEGGASPLTVPGAVSQCAASLTISYPSEALSMRP